ncbi:NACHT, LRR and PYD domains-containing protein 1b allele 1-like [Trematomus bernacchii]|uniref:NACHT, LRR and PYD domains-containing protein 1b allele 1-like n=1 Tax=Trematomus bernacchii TaxID=40690 RepID=UPI00146EE66C|nr:NACHT, LRR and PYD domains-containing protein 1b allele 1-like [Trematomus bernacchii]
MIVSHAMPSRPDFRFTHTSCESIAPPVDAQGSPTVLHDTNICTEGSGTQYGLHFPVQSNSELSADRVAQVEAPIAVRYLFTNNLLPAPSHLVPPPDHSRSSRVSSCLSRSHSMPSQSQITSAKPLTRAQSLPALLLKSIYEEFTPEITADEEEETYRFQSSCPGLYQCRLTGLVFHMEGEGELLYRIVPWNTRLLAQHHKKPAGPLFDIKCVPQSVCQLHLPHCEIRSTGACRFLSVAHVKDESIEFIRPHKVTETHVIINITGFSGFGNVKDEDSPPDPIRAQVLLFYNPPADPDPTSILNVLLLPSNVLIKDVKRKRKKIVGEETYIEIPPHCKLHPQQEYTLSTRPEDDSVRVQPPQAEFYCDDYDNYHPSFQVTLETRMKHIELDLRNSKASLSVWERRVCLSSGVKRSCEQSSLELSAHKRLRDIWSDFIERTSKPLLRSLVDKLFEKKVLTDSERESAEEKQNRSDKASFVIDTVMKKGNKASSEMITFLCDADPYLCEQLGLI